jgi:hypothetical protein
MCMTVTSKPFDETTRRGIIMGAAASLLCAPVIVCGAGDAALLAGLTPRDQDTVLSVVRNHPGISVAEALEHLLAAGM